jgi:putative ABC transport system permease protein
MEKEWRHRTMKRILIALLVLLAATATGVAYVNTDNAQRAAMQNAAGRIGQPFTIPDNPRLADPDHVYAALLEAATVNHVNVVRTAVGYAPDGRTQITQYVLLTGDTHLYQGFELRSGRWLAAADTAYPSRYLSTATSTDPDQVGVLRDFGGNDLIAIHGLRSAFDSLPVAGNYVVEAATPAAAQFLAALADRASGAAGTPGSLTAADFTPAGARFEGSTTSYGGLLTAIQFLIIFLTALLLAYRVLHEAKAAGIMKLHGFGAAGVWFELAGRLILTVLAGCAVVVLLVSRVIPDTTSAFTAAVYLTLLRAFLIMLAASLVTYAYVARSRISDAIKNRKDTRSLFAVNTVVKSAVSIALILVGAGIWLQYTQVAAERDRLGNWDRTKGYGIFYPVSVGNDLVEEQTGQPGPTTAEVYDLYPELNSAGGLFVDASMYEPLALTQALPSGAFRAMTVNPNYLNQFPILDSVGQPVIVPETTTDWVVLAPVTYKDRQAQIEGYFQGLRSGTGEQQGAAQAEKAMFGRDAPASVANQKVTVIWIQPGQKIFSFNPNVDPDHGNAVADPIVQVITTSNSLGVDRANMITGGANTDMKVRLSQGNPAATLAGLQPTLVRLRLADNLRHLVTMDDYAAQRIQSLQDQIRGITIAVAAIYTGLLLLTAQSLAIIFERYSRKVVVRRLFGFGFARRYREILRIFAVIWTVQLAVAVLANRLGVNPFSTEPTAPAPGLGVVVAVTGLATILELAFAIFVLARIERRNTITVLKGDF